MTPEAALFATIEQHVENRAKECPRIRRRFDYRARRALIRQRWCKATGRGEAEYANAAAEWGAARMRAVAAEGLKCRLRVRSQAWGSHNE